MEYAGGSNNPAVGYATRKGYLVSTPDASGTSVTDVGHLFGRLGVGNANYPGVNMPYYWGASADTNTPSIQVSFFPETDSEGGLNAPAKEIVLEGMAYAWTDQTPWDVPTQPSAASLPEEAGARALAASMVATLAIASSLY